LETNSTNAAKEEELNDEVLSEAYQAGEGVGEVNQLENQNQELRNELDQAKETINVLDEEIDEIEDGAITFVYDDVVFEDPYWQTQDWDSIWGEYACEDLVDSELDISELDVYVAPGSDQWPTVNIFGFCNTCEAYIMDYYSSEH
jgi:hypothetical protein